MTAKADPDGLALRRRRLLFRATHRGILEADLVLGRYVAAHVGEWGPEILGWWERLLEEPDQTILAWILEKEPTPDIFETEEMAQLRRFTRLQALRLRHADESGGQPEQ